MCLHIFFQMFNSAKLQQYFISQRLTSLTTAKNTCKSTPSTLQKPPLKQPNSYKYPLYITTNFTAFCNPKCNPICNCNFNFELFTHSFTFAFFPKKRFLNNRQNTAQTKNKRIGRKTSLLLILRPFLITY